MEIRVLRYFLTVAREESITKISSKMMIVADDAFYMQSR